MGTARFDRDRNDLDAGGLYLDMPAWGYHVFDVTAPTTRSLTAFLFLCGRTHSRPTSDLASITHPVVSGCSSEPDR